MSYKQIPGWMKFEEAYRNAVRAAPHTGARFLEIGSAFGRSAAYMGEQIQASGKEIELYCVDPWEWGPEPKLELEHAAVLALYGTPLAAFWGSMEEHAKGTWGQWWFHVVPGMSAEAAMKLRGKFDFIFLDGDHSYEGVKLDLETWLPRLAPHGVIGGDDYSETVFPGVVQAVTERFGGAHVTRARDGWRHWLWSNGGPDVLREWMA